LDPETGKRGSLFSGKLDDPLHRFGVRTTRRMEESFLDERYRAVTPFAAIIEILDDFLCAVLLLRFEAADLIAFKYRSRLYGFKAEAP